eukprot:EC714471.1.p2 GENE.EC714471.1~~EC714471.1.p2  ORF type:complete len:75 (-),score=9.80 EC714471.1:58-282(-)
MRTRDTHSTSPDTSRRVQEGSFLAHHLPVPDYYRGKRLSSRCVTVFGRPLPPTPHHTDNTLFAHPTHSNAHIVT